MREIQNNVINIRHMNKEQIAERFPNKSIQECLFRARDAYMKNFTDEYPLIKTKEPVSFRIEFRDGKYNQLLWVEDVTLNHKSELATKAELIILKLLADERFNTYDEIRWAADEYVMIKDVESGRFFVK